MGKENTLHAMKVLAPEAIALHHEISKKSGSIVSETISPRKRVNYHISHILLNKIKSVGEVGLEVEIEKIPSGVEGAQRQIRNRKGVILRSTSGTCHLIPMRSCWELSSVSMERYRR